MRLVFLLLGLLFINCNGEKRSDIIYVYPPDKSQIISIISDYKNNTRTIAIGKVEEKPKNNFIILDISDVTKLDDAFGICWNKNKQGWQLVNDGAKITKVALDTTKYIIKTKWYEDDQGIPNTKYYIKENCFTFETLSPSIIYPKENGIIERE